MLRLAAWRWCEADIIPDMLIHDGILLEVRNKEEIAAAIDDRTEPSQPDGPNN
jgi:hypothetical protein